MCLAPQPRAIFQHLNFKKCSETVSFLTFLLENVLLATAACNFSTSQLQKVVRECSVLYIFTCKCASRHSGVQFFDISTSKSGPELTCFVHFHLHSGVQFFDISTSKSGPKLTCFVHFHFKMCLAPQPRAIFQHLIFKKCSESPELTCFVHFHLKMRFSPQRRAIFQHLNFKKWSEPDMFCTFLATAACNFQHRNFKKWSEHVVLCTFLLENGLLATAACNFSTSQLQKVLRS